MSIAREAYLKTYIWALMVFAMALFVSWVYWYDLDFELRLVVGTSVLACFILLGDVFSVRVSERTAVSAWPR